MVLTRRTLLRSLAGLAALSLVACRMPTTAFRPPPTPVPTRPTRLAVGLSSTLPAPDQQQTRSAYQQAVDAVAAQGLPIDRTISFLPVSSAQSAMNDIATGFINGGTAGPPDLLAFGNRPTATTTAYLLSQMLTLLRPIDAELRRAPAADVQDYVPQALETCRVGGKQYALPTSVDPLLLLVDPRLLQAAGLAMPVDWDWQGLLGACLKLTKPPGQYAAAPETFYSMEVFLWQHGAAVLSADCKRCTLDSLAAIEAVTFYDDLFHRYKVVAPSLASAPAWSSNAGHDLLYNGARVAMIYTGGGSTSRPLQYSEPFHDQERATMMFVGAALAMTVRTPDPQQAFGVLTALATELQSHSYLAPRRSLLKTARPQEALSGWTPADLSQAEQTALVNALDYARASQLWDPAISAPFYTKLYSPLMDGTAKPDEACKAAADAINAVLQGNSGTPTAAE